LSDMDSNFSILNNFQNKKILVVGDLMLDRFISGTVERISPEAPVPVVKVKNEENKLGGSGNVIRNIKSLGGDPVLIATVGDDSVAEVVRSLLVEEGITDDGVATLGDRPTTIKTRILADRQQIVRLDNENDNHLSNDDEQIRIKKIEKYLKQCDAVIISDYSKGLITPGIASYLTSSLSKEKHLVVDPKPSNHRCYKNTGVITPNLKEASEIALLKIKNDEDLQEAAELIFEKLNCKSILVTLGERGMAIFDKQGSKMQHLHTRAREVFDVTGAGDTVISAFTLALCSGAPMLQAAEIANFAAGIVVSKLGTATVSNNELKEYMKTHLE
jgi:rfaE bifunctional protein kinase chain/domain